MSTCFVWIKLIQFEWFTEDVDTILCGQKLIFDVPFCKLNLYIYEIRF
jgi:hypothetical protein